MEVTAAVGWDGGVAVGRTQRTSRTKDAVAGGLSPLRSFTSFYYRPRGTAGCTRSPFVGLLVGS